MASLRLMISGLPSLNLGQQGFNLHYPWSQFAFLLVEPGDHRFLCSAYPLPIPVHYFLEFLYLLVQLILLFRPLVLNIHLVDISDSASWRLDMAELIDCSAARCNLGAFVLLKGAAFISFFFTFHDDVLGEDVNQLHLAFLLLVS